VQLVEFNQASTEDAMIFLKHCVQIPSWSTELAAKRPYASLEDILNAAQQQAATWSWDEIKTALDNHPHSGALGLPPIIQRTATGNKDKPMIVMTQPVTTGGKKLIILEK
jgi:hypothetical protein